MKLYNVIKQLIFEASADDWDLRKTLHKTIVKLENEVEHAFHSSEQR
jgi:hypothetical protein